MSKKYVYERTQKGNELLKIVNTLDKFKKKYPRKISQSLQFVGIYDNKAVTRILKEIVKGTKYSPLCLSNIRTEKEIRARIDKLSKELRSKVKIKTQRDLDREGIKGMMKLSERYALWWVLKEVRKNQGSQNSKKITQKECNKK